MKTPSPYLWSLALCALLALFSTLGSSEPAKDYELSYLAPEKSTPFPLAGLKSAIGADASLLEYYRCDGKSEYQILRPLPVENAKGDSLHVHDEITGESFVYRKGSFYHADGSRVKSEQLDGSHEKVDKDLFIRIAVSAFQTLEGTTNGSRLIRIMEKSRYPVEVRLGTWVSFNANRDGKRATSLSSALMLAKVGAIPEGDLPIDQLGVGGFVEWTPGLIAQRREADGELRQPPYAIVLIHELFHAYDGVRGLLDRRSVVGPKYESTEATEYRAVYFENIVRDELELQSAVHYGKEPLGKPDLIDRKGKVLLVPTPCLTDAEMSSFH